MVGGLPLRSFGEYRRSLIHGLYGYFDASKHLNASSYSRDRSDQQVLRNEDLESSDVHYGKNDTQLPSQGLIDVPLGQIDARQSQWFRKNALESSYRSTSGFNSFPESDCL